MRSFIFPGQGSQSVGMGLEEYRERGTVRDIFDRANDVLGYRLTDVMFEGPDDDLTATQNAQPALFVHAYALYQLLDEPRPGIVAGHSLGEYTALAVAGALSFDEALRLVRRRAEAMGAAGQEREGTMGAVIGLEDEKVEEICSRVGAETGETVVPANFNADGQVVISGTVPGVTAALEGAKAEGARMARQINVSGAFHSPLMSTAADALSEALASATIVDPSIPVCMNVTAEPTTDADEIRRLLLEQLTSPVRWTGSIRRMIAEGVTEFVEVGPGVVLSKLVGRIDRSVEATSVGSLAAVTAFNEKGSDDDTTDNQPQNPEEKKG